jgi:aromatic-L-amino-acid decarboxylase
VEFPENFEGDFARVGRWIAQYLEHPDDYAVLSKAVPGQIRDALPADAPEEPEPFDRLIADFERIILPGITHWNHPRFFAYFATSAAPVAIAAEALVATLDVKAMLWRTSPAATELEEVVMRWLGRLMGLPDEFTGIIYDTASIGGFTALAAARQRLDPSIREHGMSGQPDLRVYITEHTHSHVEKGAIALGIGRRNVIRVPCDSSGRMIPQELESQIARDVAGGKRPMAVVATVGTTSMTSIDPVAQIGAIARRHGVWLHVDAAYAGVAAICPEFAWILEGCEAADSLVVNPHKWLFVPMDCSALYVRDEALLRQAFSLVPEYLTTTDDGGVRNYMDYGLQLGRRFRALKLWFVLRHFGAQGLRRRLRAHVALAAEFARWVEEEPGWEVAAAHPFALVCFRHAPPELEPTQLDAHNERLMNAANATGEIFLSHTKLDGAFVLRLSIGNLRTSLADVATAWRVLRNAAGSVA